MTFSSFHKFLGTEKKYLAVIAIVFVAAFLYIHPVAAQTPTNTTNDTTGNEIVPDTNTDFPPSSTTQGTNDYFLKIDGIPGESKDDKHKDEIELESFSWGVSQLGNKSTGGGGGAGKATFNDFNFTSRVSKASPLLFLNTTTGKHLKTATLVVRKKGEGQQEYYIVKLSDVLISSYHSVGNNGETPLDKVSLNYSKIEFEYKPQKADGSLDTSIKAGWDLKGNKGL